MNLSTIIDFQDHCTPRTPLQDPWRSVCLCGDIFGSVWDTLHDGRVDRWGKHSFSICWTHEIGQISRTAAWRPPAASVPTALRTWPKETRVDRPKTRCWSTVDLRALIWMTYSVRHVYLSWLLNGLFCAAYGSCCLADPWSCEKCPFCTTDMTADESCGLATENLLSQCVPENMPSVSDP